MFSSSCSESSDSSTPSACPSASSVFSSSRSSSLRSSFSSRAISSSSAYRAARRGTPPRRRGNGGASFQPLLRSNARVPQPRRLGRRLDGLRRRLSHRLARSRGRELVRHNRRRVLVPDLSVRSLQGRQQRQWWRRPSTEKHPPPLGRGRRLEGGGADRVPRPPTSVQAVAMARRSPLAVRSLTLRLRLSSPTSASTPTCFSLDTWRASSSCAARFAAARALAVSFSCGLIWWCALPARQRRA